MSGGSAVRGGGAGGRRRRAAPTADRSRTTLAPLQVFTRWTLKMMTVVEPPGQPA